MLQWPTTISAPVGWHQRGLVAHPAVAWARPHSLMQANNAHPNTSPHPPLRTWYAGLPIQLAGGAHKPAHDQIP
jgi:hypothetical protein